MKFIKKVVNWILLSLALQFALLIFIDIFYLNSNSQAVVTFSNMLESPNISNKENIKIPAEAEEPKVSFDGHFIGYISNNTLDVINVQDGNKVKEIVQGYDKSLSYFRWMPDRNIIIYSKVSSENPCDVEIATYNLESGDEYKYPLINNLVQESEVLNIELSPFTNVVYVQIKTNSNEQRIYKYDIMGHLSYIRKTSIDVVFKEAYLSDKLISQTREGKVTIESNNSKIFYSNLSSEKYQLLGIDNRDKIYLGKLDSDNKIRQIEVMELDSKTKTDNLKIDLEKPILPENIIITFNGQIYYKDVDNSMIKEIKSNQKIKYDGKLIDISDGFFACLNKNVIKLQPLEKNK